MVKFRFVVEDDPQSARQGTLEARDQEHALEILRRRGFRQISLKPVEAPALSVLPPGHSPALPAPSYKRDVLLFLLGLAGLLGCLVHLKSAPAAGGVAQESAQETCHLRVDGILGGPKPSDWSKVSILLDFPEVPLQWSRPWLELEHPTPNGFRIEAKFSCQTRPRSFRVCLQQSQETQVAKDFLYGPEDHQFSCRLELPPAELRVPPI